MHDLYERSSYAAVLDAGLPLIANLSGVQSHREIEAMLNAMIMLFCKSEIVGRGHRS
jgi:hypothetical protein